MKKIELKIAGISISPSNTSSYIIVLEEKNKVSGVRLPLVIKPQDAQYILMKLEGEKTKPLIQDLFKELTDRFTNLDHVLIKDVREGIPYCDLLFKSGVSEEFSIECSVGDAISLSITFKCPIFSNKSVLDSCGIILDDRDIYVDGEIEFEYSDDYDNSEFLPSKKDPMVTIQDLENMLIKAVQNEEYEIASQLRDRIDALKDKNRKC